MRLTREARKVLRAACGGAFIFDVSDRDLRRGYLYRQGGRKVRRRVVWRLYDAALIMHGWVGQFPHCTPAWDVTERGRAAVRRSYVD